MLTARSFVLFCSFWWLSASATPSARGVAARPRPGGSLGLGALGLLGLLGLGAFGVPLGGQRGAQADLLGDRGQLPPGLVDGGWDAAAREGHSGRRRTVSLLLDLAYGPGGVGRVGLRGAEPGDIADGRGLQLRQAGVGEGAVAALGPGRGVRGPAPMQIAGQGLGARGQGCGTPSRR
ncbi:hypothetical protein ABZ260_51060 [Streptosporangium sp. NPDC006013]|uniref:hypothetical protein n=1 Tax=Streptosporangium sp. NPDC006013 TaxID=3155596 RepID=UPI0033A303D7